MAFGFDDVGLGDFEQRIIGRAQAVLREVIASHSGQPRPLVDAHLRQRFAETGFTPEDAVVVRLVDAISAGTLNP